MSSFKWKMGLEMIDITKIKPYDILYTIHDQFDDCDGSIVPPANLGKISICVKEICKLSDICELSDKRIGILAQGQCWYPIEDLTDQQPETYQPFGEEFLKDKPKN